MTFNFIGTGIGSMPFTEPEDALDLIAKSMPYIPHWPQLPKRGMQEHFVFQYLAPLVKVGLITVSEDKAPFINITADDFTDKLTLFYELYLNAEAGDDDALASFAFPLDSAKGFYAFCNVAKKGYFSEAKFYKGQISGPLSVALDLTDENRRAVYYDLQLRDVIIKTLALQAKWQARTLTALGRKAIIFIDDPYLYALGASTHITITKEEVVSELKTIIDAVKSEGALVGIHSCANVDWALLLSLGLDFLSFDAYGFFDNLLLYAADIKKFLNDGGNLAWGIVPTSEQIFNESPASLLQKLSAQINALAEKGVPQELILSNAILTPSCGTGTLSKEATEKVYEFMKSLSNIKPVP